MAPEHGLCTSAFGKILTALRTRRARKPLNFICILFKFLEKLLCCVRITEQLLCLGVHFTACSCLNNLPTATIRRSGLRIDSSGGVIGAGCLIRTSRSGGILLFLWHRFGLNYSLWSFALRGGRLLLIPLLGEMFLKTLGNFCLECFYLFCLPLSQAGQALGRLE